MSRIVAIIFGLMLSVQVTGQGNFFWSHTGKIQVDSLSYGNLYNWYAVDAASNHDGFINGMHVPTSSEYSALENYIGYSSSDILRSTRVFPDPHPRWDTDNSGALDSYGFSAYPGGTRSGFNGTFDDLGSRGNYWSSTTGEGIVFIDQAPWATWGAGLDDGGSLRLLRSTTTAENSLPDGTIVEIVTDYDGNQYETVKIGGQVWTVQNLKTTTYLDGTNIPLVEDNTDWSNLTTPGYCIYPESEY